MSGLNVFFRRLWGQKALAAAMVLVVSSWCAWGESLLGNGDFENLTRQGGQGQAESMLINGWEFSSWKNDGAFSACWPDKQVFHDGVVSIRLRNFQADDAKLTQKVKVEPGTWYRAWAWIKTEGVGDEGVGANISAEDIFDTSRQLKGNHDWTFVEVYGKTGPKQDSLALTLRLGGYGNTSTGTVWFDGAGFEKVLVPPAGATTIKWYKPPENSVLKYLTSADSLPPLYTVLALWLLCFALAAWVIRQGGLQPRLDPADQRAFRKRFLLVLGFALVIKTVLAGAISGYSTDVSAFAAWSRDVFARGPAGFYQEGYFADYPPAYILVLWVIGGIRSLFALKEISFVGLALLKLPAILADLALCFFLYRLVMKQQSPGAKPASPLAWALGLVVLILPLSTMDSSVWGQVDSIFTLVMILAIWMLEERRLVPAAAFYALAVLLKPQALLVAPIALAGIIDAFKAGQMQKTLRDLVLAVAAFIAVCVAVILPFGWGKEPGWIFSLYAGTLGSYPYASLNAPNLWTLLGMNWSAVGQPVLGVPVSVLSWIMVSPVLVYALVLGLKGKGKGKLLYAAFVMMTAFFVLGAKMHERYLYPAVFLALAAFVLVRDWRVLVMGLALGISASVNLFSVLLHWNNLQTTGVAVWDPLLLICGAVNAGVLVWAVIVGWQLLWKGEDAREPAWDSFQAGLPLLLGDGLEPGQDKDYPAQKTVPDKKLTAKNLAKTKAGGTGKSGKTASSKSNAKKGKPSAAKLDPKAAEKTTPLPDLALEQPALAKTLGRGRMGALDWKIMLGITLVYAVLALFNLGNTSSPQTAWAPKAPGEDVVFDLGQVTDVTKAGYHWGLDTGSYRIDWSVDGMNWIPGEKIENTNRFVEMRWYYTDLSVHARYGRIISLTGKQELDELTLWSGEKLLSPRLVTGSPLIFDEQATATLISDYTNGMYFDEVYHARAAWEYLHGRDSSENTHPPLGKLIIALGVKAFGMNTWGWRVMGCVFGILMLPVFYLIALRLFRETRWAALALGFFALDFMHFTQTRISTIDTYGVFFILLSYLFMLAFLQGNLLKDSRLSLGLRLLGSGVAFGLGAASKWIVIYAGAGLLIFWLARVIQDLAAKVPVDTPVDEAGVADRGGRSKSGILGFVLGISVLSFLVIPGIIYTASYIPMMEFTHKGLPAMLENQPGMFNYHAKLQATHPFSSYWYQWPLMTRPIYYYSGSHVVPEEQLSAIYAFGNPVVWWLGSLAFLWLFLSTLVNRIGKFKPSYAPSPWAVFFILCGGLVQYMPWAIIPRQLVFIYHFFATVPFLILALVFVLADLDRARTSQLAAYPQLRTRLKAPRTLFAWLGDHKHWVLLALAALLFVYFYPVMSGLPVPKAWYGLMRALNGGWPY